MRRRPHPVPVPVSHAQLMLSVTAGTTDPVFKQTELKSALGVIFVVRAITLQYKRAAVFNDALEVVTLLHKVGRSLLVFEQKIYRQQETLTEAEVEVVCVNAVDFKPVSIPPAVRRMMASVLTTAQENN